MVRQGDIVWLNFDPQAGYEQRGKRPALVVSGNTFNNFSKMAIVCPITTRDKNHPFHVRLSGRLRTQGVSLCDQVRTLDIQARNFEFIERLSEDILLEVIDILNCFIEIESS
jgi:mRNA interferase MazF